MSTPGEEQIASNNDGLATHEDTIQEPVLEKYSAGEDLTPTITISEADQSNAEEFKNQGNEHLKSELILTPNPNNITSNHRCSDTDLLCIVYFFQIRTLIKQ